MAINGDVLGGCQEARLAWRRRLTLELVVGARNNGDAHMLLSGLQHDEH